MKRLLTILRRNGGQIAYYGGIVLALTALAFAAERYRGSSDAELRAPVLPVIELAAPEEASKREANPFYAPDDAEVLRSYAEKPEWNSALELWENHRAIDYLLEGDHVLSLSEGVVRAVGVSGTFGGFVEIESGEYLLRYASIAPNARLNPGDTLKIGDTVGAVNASMAAESNLGAHLHLEVLCGEEYLDFTALYDPE